MNQFIVQLLIVTLLTSNIAWAADSCVLTETSETSNVIVQADENLPVNLPTKTFGCENCCAACSGIIALPNSFYVNDYTPFTINGGFYTFSYFSLPIPPPFHPPIS